MQFVSSWSMELDETIYYCWFPIVMKCSLWFKNMTIWVRHCDVTHWDKQSFVTVAVDLLPVKQGFVTVAVGRLPVHFCHLTFNLSVSHTLHAHPSNHWYAQGTCVIIQNVLHLHHNGLFTVHHNRLSGPDVCVYYSNKHDMIAGLGCICQNIRGQNWYGSHYWIM